MPPQGMPFPDAHLRGSPPPCERMGGEPLPSTRLRGSLASGAQLRGSPSPDAHLRGSPPPAAHLRALPPPAARLADPSYTKVFYRPVLPGLEPRYALSEPSELPVYQRLVAGVRGHPSVARARCPVRRRSELP